MNAPSFLSFKRSCVRWLLKESAKLGIVDLFWQQDMVFLEFDATTMPALILLPQGDIEPSGELKKWASGVRAEGHAAELVWSLAEFQSFIRIWSAAHMRKAVAA